MRDLSRYPLTAREVVEVLRKMERDVAKKGQIGDMRPLCLQAAQRCVLAVDYAQFQSFKPTGDPLPPPPEGASE